MIFDVDAFDSASIAALGKFTFDPRIVDGEAVATPYVRYLFRFSLEENETTISEMQERYKALQGR